jgi:hypothetical protein
MGDLLIQERARYRHYQDGREEGVL